MVCVDVKHGFYLFLTSAQDAGSFTVVNEAPRGSVVEVDGDLNTSSRGDVLHHFEPGNLGRSVFVFHVHVWA